MVKRSFIPSVRGLVSCAAAFGLLFVAGCRTVQPVDVDGSFTTSPQFATRSPSIVSLLPIEDGTKDGAAARHLTFVRQEINRQLPDRRFSPTRQTWVDASLRGAMPAGESILTPQKLAALAQAGKDDAVLAVRIDQWDESMLMANHKVQFRFEAAMVAADGTPLWSGTIQGKVKAGGAGAAPLGRDAAARSCIELAVNELLLRLPDRTVR